MPRGGVERLVRTAGLLAIFMACLTAFAQEATATFTFSGATLEGPSQLPVGFHTVTLQNDDAGSTLDITLFRMVGNATVEDVVAAFQAVDQAYAGGNPVAAVNEVVKLGESWGGPAAREVGSSSVGLDLPEGQYAVVATVHQQIHGHEGGPPAPATYIASALEVTAAADAAEAPHADVVVQMVDFAFAIPANVQAGAQTWEIVNIGEQLHHMVLVRLQDGKTMDDLQAFMQGGEQGQPPVDEVGQTNILSPGVSNYVSLDLTPGTYIMLCFLPDHAGNATGAPHVALGMMETFTVADE